MEENLIKNAQSKFETIKHIEKMYVLDIICT